VLVTRLPAVEDAAAMDTLVSDKTGTLTQNRLTLAGVRVLDAAVREDEVLRVAAMASDEATQDPIDLALRQPARERGLLASAPARTAFAPFDPATRRSEATYLVEGRTWRVVKGASSTLVTLCALDATQQAALARVEAELAADGARVLAVAAGDEQGLHLLGAVGLADPVRPDAGELITQLRVLGVRVRMATGDALETALAVGQRLGLGTRVCQAESDALRRIEDCDVFARVLPQDKHAIVAALQERGHVTGMTGDGVNDAPALHQAEVGVAVDTATDVAKAAAGAVLTEPGLAGVLALVREGRLVHRRMLTYTLNKILKTIQITVLLTMGLLLTGEFVISSALVVLLLFANDFVTMAIASDSAPHSPRPQRWHVRPLMTGALALAALSVGFSAGFYAWARLTQGLDMGQARTLAFLLLVFTNQAHVYVLRTDGPFWSLWPSRALLLATVADVLVVAWMAGHGVLMTALPWALIGWTVLASLVFVPVLDLAKRILFKRFEID
jgi:H+-transporting ATPase